MPRRKTRNVTDFPVMKEKCATCPFRAGGWESLREIVTERVLTDASQTCHSTGVIHGKEDTHLCRGARDLQLQMFYAMGFLPEPTDAAWAAKVAELRKEGKLK